MIYFDETSRQRFITSGYEEYGFTIGKEYDRRFYGGVETLLTNTTGYYPMLDAANSLVWYKKDGGNYLSQVWQELANGEANITRTTVTRDYATVELENVTDFEGSVDELTEYVGQQEAGYYKRTVNGSASVVRAVVSVDSISSVEVTYDATAYESSEAEKQAVQENIRSSIAAIPEIEQQKNAYIIQAEIYKLLSDLKTNQTAIAETLTRVNTIFGENNE